MANIFVWKAYGDIEVYVFETEKQVEKVWRSIADSAVDTIPAEVLDKVGNKISGMNGTQALPIMNALFRKYIYGFYDNDAFEPGTSFTTLKED